MCSLHYATLWIRRIRWNNKTYIIKVTDISLVAFSITTTRMNIDKGKLTKKLFKWYLIYHLVIDLLILGQFTYWHLNHQTTWYYRIIDTPSMLVEFLLFTPIALICNGIELAFTLMF